MRHIYGTCHNADCPACQHLAEVRKDGDEYSSPERDRLADMQADREERQRDEMWGWAS